eukprot:5672093-Amphidinium_carterae.1
MGIWRLTNVLEYTLSIARLKSASSRGKSLDLFSRNHLNARSGVLSSAGRAACKAAHAVRDVPGLRMCSPVMCSQTAVLGVERSITSLGSTISIHKLRTGVLPC